MTITSGMRMLLDRRGGVLGGAHWAGPLRGAGHCVPPGAGNGRPTTEPGAPTGAEAPTGAFAGGRFAKHRQQNEADAGFIAPQPPHVRASLVTGGGVPSSSAI